MKIKLPSLDSYCLEAMKTPISLEEIKASLILLGQREHTKEDLKIYLRFYLFILENDI